MQTLRGSTAILTGASGGIGGCVARSLAAEGINILLVAFPGSDLPSLCAQINGREVRSRFLIADLREPTERARVVEEAIKYFGYVDILVNSAGVDSCSFYHQLTEFQIRDVISINLEAPMMLTRLVIPSMFKRRRGHIINISSLAGKSGPGFQEPYAATKAGLIAFTYSLRGTYDGSGVSASVICPGFVESGIYTRIKAKAGCVAPTLLGSVPPERVAQAVIRAIQRDIPEILINRWPVRPLLALSAIFPSMGEWISKKIGVHDFFRRFVEAEHPKRPPQSPN